MKDYKDTLNLPNTEFPMRANLPTKEPETLKSWNENGLYKKMLAKNEGKTPFILHDGPPFSNGNIHIGTALNKILKDFIVKSKAMGGYYTPYVPGWDNHGMPIESAIIKKSKLDRKNMSVSEFRKACADFAQDFVDLQRTSFRRLGAVGDWDNPYLTMDPKFEAREIRVFGEMFKRGYIYKGLKPVYWCASDETALAEAEIEYKDAPCTSIYVKFKVTDDKGLLAQYCDLNNTYFVIWTTTPWTLPGNMAIAVHPRDAYSLIKVESGECYIMADALIEASLKNAGISNWEVLASFKGGDFEYMKAQHPFLDRESLLVTAEYVTMDSGTGCVHTAPGFGVDDYITGMRYGIEIVVPVDDRGFQTEAAGKFAGLFYEKSNAAILDDLKESGALLASEEIIHPYPHCWRCKKPIIFRATPQWFCSVKAFKEAAVKACESVEWMPAWGGDRMVSMINERADWCISRQRNWGLPIPVFYCEDCGEVICSEETIDSVANIFAEKGSNAWFDMEASDLLPKGYVCPKCGKTHFVKETDTLDGWFDSGSTHFMVLDGEEGLGRPSDLYLEGADQYRGWFQSSLLTCIGSGLTEAPYKAVLTHGWTVDGEGKAMHKSLGNAVAPETVIEKYGADILRLWVASSDYRVDVRASDAIFKQLSESYRKIRNTLRILLANLGTVESDFNPATDMVAPEKLGDIDKWALSRLNKLIKRVRDAYDSYQFHIVYHDIHNFCSIDMSKLYIDITKDRLYCENKNDISRRSTQTAMFIIVSALTRLLAPVLSFTAEETWGFMSHTAEDDLDSVFCNALPEVNPAFDFAEIEAKYEALFNLRDSVMKALEIARAEKTIGKSLEAKVTIYTSNNGEAEKLFAEFEGILPEIFIVSKVELSKDNAPENAYTDEETNISVAVAVAEGEKCVRCWMHKDDCTPDEDGQQLCARCRNAVC
ncbi:MAG: isoleucine--tRNA ligase [Ruminococcaceae bacterium]|nr:isoleucine--tRNA ligase [Oscillospiraceae bacterium]